MLTAALLFLHAQSASVTVSGTAFDQVGGLLPYVKVTLTNRGTMAHGEGQTDQQGHFEINGLAPGDYVIEAERSGFEPLHDGLTLSAGEQAQHDITLQVAPLEERIVVSAEYPLRETRVTDVRDEGKCEVAAVGGSWQPPAKTSEVRPEYPRQLLEGRVSGTVVLSGQVSTEGRLRNLKVVSGRQEFADESISALEQWEWTVPRLDCIPIDASITVFVEYSLR
jgi:TonB family protein